jgi:ABC-type oligopeptide transport system substrate-binding subunit
MDPYSLLDLISTPTGENGTGWWDRKYVAMLNDANRQPDPQKRYELLAKAEAYMLEAQPVLPLYTAGSDWLKKPYVKGMYSNPVVLHAWKFVYIEHDRSKWDLDDPPAKTTN